MILGSKPLSEMTLEEMQVATQALRDAREALLAEARKKAKEKAEKTVVVGEGGTTVRRTRTPKAPSEKDKLAADMLAFLKED